MFGIEEQGLADVNAQIIDLGGSVAASNMAVGSFLNTNGSATVQVYKQGGAPGDSGVSQTPSGVTIILPAISFPAEAANTWY